MAKEEVSALEEVDDVIYIVAGATKTIKPEIFAWIKQTTQEGNGDPSPKRSVQILHKIVSVTGAEGVGAVDSLKMLSARLKILVRVLEDFEPERLSQEQSPVSVLEEGRGVGDYAAIAANLGKVFAGVLASNKESNAAEAMTNGDESALAGAIGETGQFNLTPSLFPALLKSFSQNNSRSSLTVAGLMVDRAQAGVNAVGLRPVEGRSSSQ